MQVDGPFPGVYCDKEQVLQIGRAVFRADAKAIFGVARSLALAKRRIGEALF